MKIEVSKDTAKRLAIHSATIGDGVNKIAEAFIRTQLDMYYEQKAQRRSSRHMCKTEPRASG